jgi:hypothetical protein
MNKIINMILLAMVIFLVHSCSFAESTESTDKKPFQGTFGGTIIGDQNSRASITLNLTQHGAKVTGTAIVGEGLSVYSGFLPHGVTTLPSECLNVIGITDNENNHHLETTLTTSKSGITVGVAVADLPVDCKTMSVHIKLDIPLLCRGSTLNATLCRMNLL